MALAVVLTVILETYTKGSIPLIFWLALPFAALHDLAWVILLGTITRPRRNGK